MKEIIYYEAKVKKAKTPIEKTIKKLGIVYPNSSLGFMHAIFASVDGKSPNGNGVILDTTVADDVPKLKFTQANKNHKREKGIVLGSILNAWVNPKTKDIEIVFSMFKSLYPKLWEDAQEDLKKGNLTVSFELKVDKKDITIMPNGNKKLAHVDFDGVGVLFNGIKPAYKNASVLELANKIVNEVFQQSQSEVIYASAKDVVEKLENTSKIIEAEIYNTKGGVNMEQKVKDALLAKFKDEVTVELGEEAVKDWSEEQWEAELTKRAELDTVDEKVEAEEEVKDEKVEAEEEVKDEKVEAEKIVQETKEVINQKMTYDTDTQEETVETEATREVKNDGKVVVTEKVKKEVTYSFAEMEAVKAEYEEKLAAKDEEIKFIRENASKVAEIRTDLGDFVKDLSDQELFDEKLIKIAKLEKQVSDLKAKDIETANEDEKPAEDLKAVDEDKKEEVEESSDDRIKKYLKARKKQ